MKRYKIVVYRYGKEIKQFETDIVDLKKLEQEISIDTSIQITKNDI